jgi:hypothetical protein
MDETKKKYIYIYKSSKKRNEDMLCRKKIIKEKKKEIKVEQKSKMKGTNNGIKR